MTPVCLSILCGERMTVKTEIRGTEKYLYRLREKGSTFMQSAIDVRSSKDESRVSLFCKKENARSCLGLILVYECTILFPSSQGKDLALLFYYRVSIAF